MIEQLTEIVNRYHDDNENTAFFSVGEIPSLKLSSSTKFHGVDSGDTVLALIARPDSIFGSAAKHGMSITLKGIYWKNDWMCKTSKSSYTWDELQRIYKQIEIDWGKSGGNMVFEPSVKFDIPWNYSSESLLHLIQTLTEFFAETND
ncbi:MAG: hypothetical protein WCI06_04915 [Methylococcaceae bacterium]